MALPKAAQRQVEEANRILESISNGQRQDEEKEDARLKVVEQPEEQPIVEKAVEPVAEKPAEPVAEKPAEPADNFEHKYNVLQGKYDKEVPRMRKEIQILTEELDSVRGLLSQMQQTKPKESSTASATAKFVTDEEIEEYGSDLIDLVGRRAKEVYEPIVSELKSEVDNLKKQLGGVSKTVTASSRDRVLAQLDERVEDWRTLNESEEFLDWLDERDPYSGDQRGRMLRTAFQANDAERVIAFFNGFKNEHAVVSQSASADSSTAQAGRGTPAVDLNDLTAPGRAARTPATPTSTQEPKRVWTRPQIAEFYRDVQLGKFKGEAAEKTKKIIERDILKAASEGRIRD